MDMHSAFLDDIVEHYDDDAPRLIYADWLEDHGDGERAEFIRVQCRLEGMAKEDAEYAGLKAREGELLRRNRSAWLGPWGWQHNSAWFRRGFPDTLFLRLLGSVALADLVSNIHPRLSLLTSLALPESRQTPNLVSMFGTARLRCLRSLRCSGGCSGKDLVAGLLSWPSEVVLDELRLSGCQIDSATLRLLSGATWLSELRSLDLRRNPFDENALLHFLRNAPLSQLETFAHMGTQSADRWNRDLFGPVATALFERLPALIDYRLTDSQVESEGMEQFVASGVVSRLTKLEMNNTAIGDAGVIALARSTSANLTALLLRQNDITDVGLRALADSPVLSNVTELDLSWNRLEAGGVRSIAESPRLKSVATLRIGSLISSASTFADPLLAPGTLPALRELQVPARICTSDLVNRFAARGVTLTHYGQ